MIRTGETIENPITGERMTFLRTSADTVGEFVLVDVSVAPGGFVAAEHVHPFQYERFEILSGEIELEVDGEVRIPRPGEIVTVGPGTPHRFRNVGDEELRFRTEVRPALDFEIFLETMFALAAEGKTNASGMPNPLRLAVIMEEHFDLVRLPSLPAWVQRVGLVLGAPLGRLFGYESSHVLREVEEVDRAA